MCSEGEIDFLREAESERARERDLLTVPYSKSHCARVRRVALSKAEVLLSMRLQDSCLERVWGAGGASRPVRVLRKQFEEVVREYLVNNELSEAVNAVLELDVPHYAHELVHRAVCAWLEQRTMFVRELCADARPDPTGAETRHLLALFKGLSDAGVLSSEQFQQVCTRLISIRNFLDLFDYTRTVLNSALFISVDRTTVPVFESTRLASFCQQCPIPSHRCSNASSCTLQGISRVLGDLKELLLDFGPQTLGCLEELLRRCDALRLLPSDVTRKMLRDVALHRFAFLSY